MKQYAQEIHRQLPDPHLTGWFAVALSRELRPGDHKTIIVAEKNYYLQRSTQGQLFLNKNMDAVIEQNEFIFIWTHPKGNAPNWFIPILDLKDWSPFLHHHLIVRSHPQEIYENSIDMAHFSVVHGFHDVNVMHPPCFSKHTMFVKHKIKRKNASFFRNNVYAEFEVNLHGIGFAYNHIHVPSYNMNVCMLVLATPIHYGYTTIKLAVAIKLNNRRDIKKWILPIIHRKIHKNIIHDFCQDIAIWENKCYRSFPLLVKQDGPIIPFRKWCKQFFSESN